MRVRKVVVIAVTAMGIGAAAMTAPVTAGEPTAGKPGLVTPEQQKRLDLMKSKGAEASLTILPVRLGGKPFDRVTEVVGLLLEMQGLKNIELGKTALEPAPKTDLQGLAASVGEFVKGQAIPTEYVLYAEINGTRETGITELRAVVADKAGRVVWTDRQTPEDEAFRALKPREPMTCCLLLVQRLGPQLGLNEETRRAAKPGKMAAIMDQRSGMPPASERAPLPERQKQWKQSRQEATLMVFPARVRGAADTASATDLAKMIQGAGLCKAVPAQQSVLLKPSQPDPNEMKVLWDLAREFRDHLRKNPPDADYVLYADYAFNPQRWEQGCVHFVVCDRNGEWVIVDMQNSHHPDYRSIKPTSREGCDEILLKRLEGYLR